MSYMSGGQAVVKTLMALGARRGFGVPGESFLAVLDAFAMRRVSPSPGAGMRVGRLLWLRLGPN